jgi:hypothetical protein
MTSSTLHWHAVAEKVRLDAQRIAMIAPHSGAPQNENKYSITIDCHHMSRGLTIVCQLLPWAVQKSTNSFVCFRNGYCKRKKRRWRHLGSTQLCNLSGSSVSEPCRHYENKTLDNSQKSWVGHTCTLDNSQNDTKLVPQSLTNKLRRMRQTGQTTQRHFQRQPILQTRDPTKQMCDALRVCNDRWP